ncbi:Monocarboxylate transporter 12 [Chionoecetes opilio]|uniref:Monocarboxylate transporter 12 n=1 Tax=Chionoecetes opilio TaxID=41210 RepID=A0A8J4XQD3_CHIOP|nr:Monocarboxylate transporter 12 [Chionoecetes opilio]
MWAVDVVSRPVRAAGMGGVAADAVSAEDSDQDGESPNSGGDDSVGLTDSPSRPAPTHDNSLQYHLDAVSVAVVKGGCVVQVSHEGQKDAEMGLAGNFSTLPPDSLGDKLIGDYKEKVSFCESPYNGETTSGSEEWSPRSMVDSSTQTGPGWEEGALLAARKRKSRTLEDVSDQHEVEVTEIKTHDRESQAGQSCLEVNMPLSSKISLVQRRQKQSNSDYSSLSSSDSPRVSDTSNRSDSGNSPGSSSSSSSTNGASIKTREPKFKKSSACGELSPIASCSGDSSVPAGLSVSVGLSPDPNGFVALSPDPSSKDLGSRSPCTPTSGCLKAGTRASSGAHVQFHTPYDNEEKGEEQQRLLHDTVVTQGGQVTLRKPPCSASTPTSGDLLPRLWTKLPDTSPAEVTSSLSIPKKWRGRHISGSSSISLGSSSSSSENSGATELERRAPDGGWGWVIVAASFMVHCIADGITMSFGVLFVELLSYFQEGKSLTSWVGSLFMAIPLLAGPLASILTDRYGCQTVTICGAVVASLGFFVSAFVNTIPLLLLTVGIITGLGLAVCYVAAIVIVAFYFEKKRSLATGIAVAGSGIGTFLFAPLIQHLMDNWGWRLSFILLAGVLLNMVVCGALMRDLEWTPRDSSSHRNTRSTPAPSSHRGSTSQSSETVGGRAGHLALPSLDELRRLVQSGDVAALLSPEEHSVETLRESASMVLLPTFLSRSQALPPDVIPCLSSRTNAYEVVSQMYPHLLSHSFSGTLDQVLPQGEKKSQKSQTHQENMPDYASTTLASIGSSGGCSQDNRAAAHGEAHPSDTDDTTPSSVPTPAPSTTSQAHKLDIQLGSSAEDDGDEADNEEENEDPQEGTAMLAQSRPTKGPRQPGPRRISGGCMGASSPPPPAAPLRNMKINRQSMTYRGAMLNIQRYRLRASSCPDIYRNSITTIAKAQDEADWTYLDDMSEMLTACVDVTYCMDASYLVFAVSNFVLYVFYDTVYMYLTDYAQGVGVSADDSANLISVIGILNCMGMVMMGYMGDRSWSSPMLMYNISMVMCGLSVLVMPFITNYWLIALAAAVFGLFISANYALTSVIVVELVSLESFSKAYGLLLMIQGVANLIGPPLVDLLKPANKSRDTSQDNFTMAVSKELRGRKVDISEPPPAVQRQAFTPTCY